jgi:AcrR family transcriptional regulator
MMHNASMASATRSYGGIAAEERRATRRRLLMEAALDLFAEDGARGVSKRAVCARARLNDRYFYEHFTDSDALLEAVVRDLTAQGLEAVGAATREAPADIRGQVRATADAALEFVTADPRIGKFVIGSSTSEPLQRARVDSTRAIAAAMSASIRELLGDTAASQLNTDLAAFALVSGATEVIVAWLRGEFDISRQHVADLVAGLLLATADISTALPKSPGGVKAAQPDSAANK